MTELSRRSILKTGLMVAAGMAVRPSEAGQGSEQCKAAQRKFDPYGGFKMGIQSYSLRGYSVTDALKHSQSLGLGYWESFSRHLPVTSDKKVIASYKKMLKEHGVKLIAYGVQAFGRDHDANRREFDFAKAMGIETISANPTDESLDSLDKLVEEYQINIAIHNHGPGAMYDRIEDCMRVMVNHHHRIGACVDTGHYIRSNVDPLEAIATFKKRTYGVHLKDVKTSADGAKKFTILGEGDLDVPAILSSLISLKYVHSLSLEYEENPKNPIADIKKCLEVVKDSVKKVS